MGSILIFVRTSVAINSLTMDPRCTCLMLFGHMVESDNSIAVWRTSIFIISILATLTTEPVSVYLYFDILECLKLFMID